MNLKRFREHRLRRLNYSYALFLLFYAVAAIIIYMCIAYILLDSVKNIYKHDENSVMIIVALSMYSSSSNLITPTTLSEAWTSSYPTVQASRF